jgi:SMI1-KNR4 cell-wall
MELSEVIAELRSLNEPVPKPLRLPTETEVKAAENDLRVTFPTEYREYLLTVSDVVYGAMEPAVVLPDAGHLYLVDMAESAWDKMELPRTLLPICEDNGDYYCLNSKAEVEFWSHNGATDEKWPNLSSWIKEVWIDGE